MHVHKLSPSALALDLDEFGRADRGAIGPGQWFSLMRRCSMRSVGGRCFVHGRTVGMLRDG